MCSFKWETNIMKKILFAALLLTTLPSFAGGWETIKGSGNLKTETRSASQYNAISNSGAFSIDIQYGSSTSITIEADDNLLPYIETVVEAGELKVRGKKGYNLSSKNKMHVTVSLTRLTALKLSGSGSIKGDGDFSNDGTTDIIISGSGHIKISFAKFNGLNTRISGSGSMKLAGKSGANINAVISGSGSIDAYEVSVSDVKATISGSGDIYVAPSKSLDAIISGSGNILYKGDAVNVSKRTSGSGKVKKA